MQLDVIMSGSFGRYSTTVTLFDLLDWSAKCNQESQVIGQ